MATIVRRRVTVTTRGVVDLPFSCAGCGLATLAHVNATGVGHASSAYVAPDEEGATRAAQASLRTNAQAVVDACLCPRCGTPAQALQNAIAAWDAETEGGRRIRKPRVLAIGLGVTFSLAMSCLVAMIAAPTAGKTAADMVGAAVCMAVGISLVGGLIALLFYLRSGPGARPVIPKANPTTLWFDRPPGM